MPNDYSSPLTAQEHHELAQELRDVSGRLRELQRLVESVYGPHTPAAAGFQDVTEAVERLRRVMQVQMVDDLPGLANTDVYR